MRLALLALLATLAFQPAIAKQSPYPGMHSGQQESQLIEHGSYTNSDGKRVHSPAHTRNGKAPDGASARCRDGSYSFSQHRRGTCSRHGGVENWL